MKLTTKAIAKEMAESVIKFIEGMNRRKLDLRTIINLNTGKTARTCEEVVAEWIEDNLNKHFILKEVNLTESPS